MHNLQWFMWLQFLVLSVFAFQISIARRSTYGEVCNKSKRCDKSVWLTCISGKCDCVKPDEMIFDMETGKCASKAGERCKYLLDADGEKRYEEIDCIDNASCSANGFCSCKDDFYENSNGSCIAEGTNLEFCNETIRCATKKGFICENDICQCNQGSVFSTTYAQCVGLAGQLCIIGKCAEGADCINEQCTCEDKFYRNSEGRCQRRFGHLAKCDFDSQCQNESGYTLKCLQGVCQCDPEFSVFGFAPKHQKNCNSYDSDSYDFDSDWLYQCLGKAERRCIQGRCATGSYCQYDNCNSYESYEGNCTCKPGTKLSLSGTCRLPHFESCSTTGECLDGMVCTNKLCECRYSPSDQYYDRKKESCVSNVGRPCGNYSICANGAECRMAKNSKVSTCECKQGYVDDGGTCKLEFGMTCEDNNNCFIDGGLECIEKTCQCREFKTYNKEMNKCVGLAGADCDLNERDDQCTPNAICLERIKYSKSKSGRCFCNEGYVVSEDFTCEKSVSKTYEYDIPEIFFSASNDSDATTDDYS